MRIPMLIVAALLLTALPGRTQPTPRTESAQTLFERGAYEEALALAAEARAEDPATVYLSALAADRLDQPERVREAYAALESREDAAWQAIGRSGAAALDDRLDDALTDARTAVREDGGLALAHYQLGLVLSRRGAFDEAARVLDRAAELDPSFAYTHYYAGLAHQRARRLNPMTQHLREFLRLAPRAPERRAVELLLATMQG